MGAACCLLYGQPELGRRAATTPTHLQPFEAEQLAFATLVACTWAYLEIPMPLASAMMVLLQQPAFLIVEAHAKISHRYTQSAEDSSDGTCGVSRDTSPYVTWDSLATLVQDPDFLWRVAAMLATSWLASIASQVLLNGHRVLSHHAALHDGQQHGEEEPTEDNTGRPTNRARAWLSAVARRVSQNSVLQALFQPLLRSGWIHDWEMAFMKRMLDLRHAQLVLPIICIPNIAYTLVM
jgi:hypothetical protein